MTTPTPDEYTPTKQDIRQLWAEDQDRTFGEGYDVHAAEFDRWLAQHDAEVGEGVVTFEATSAAALDGGIRAIADECGLLPESVVEMVLTALNVRVVR